MRAKSWLGEPDTSVMNLRTSRQHVHEHARYNITRRESSELIGIRGLLQRHSDGQHAVPVRADALTQYSLSNAKVMFKDGASALYRSRTSVSSKARENIRACLIVPE
eukprot:370464-Rhodomonas_salina.3